MNNLYYDKYIKYKKKYELLKIIQLGAKAKAKAKHHDKPHDKTQDKPHDKTQDKPHDKTQDKPHDKPQKKKGEKKTKTDLSVEGKKKPLHQHPSNSDTMSNKSSSSLSLFENVKNVGKDMMNQALQNKEITDVLKTQISTIGQSVQQSVQQSLPLLKPLLQQSLPILQQSLQQSLQPSLQQSVLQPVQPVYTTVNQTNQNNQNNQANIPVEQQVSIQLPNNIILRIHSRLFNSPIYMERLQSLLDNLVTLDNDQIISKLTL